MSVQVAEKLLQDMAQSANDKDYATHMDLISQEVRVFGIPGFEVIDYDDWARQCRHKFDNNIPESVSYGPLKMLAQSPGRIMFKTLETVKAHDGSCNVNTVEIIIQKEDDEKWRVLQERILPEDEVTHNGIISAAGNA